MAPTSYLIYLSTPGMTVELSLKIFNTAGRGGSLYGQSDDSGSRLLWLIPEGKYERKETIEKLQALPGIEIISAVAMSKPVKTTELIEVRDLFTSVGWNSANVTDDELAMYINTQVQGQFTYYIDFDDSQRFKGPVAISIKRIEDHPHFSPDWLIKNEDRSERNPNKEFTIDDIEVRTVVIQSVVQYEEREEPPPPPPPKK